MDSTPTNTPPPGAEEDRLAHLIKDAWRAMVRSLQIRLVEHAVTFGHWSFLRILWKEDGLTQRELAQRAGMSTPTTFTAVKAMESLGYVSRKQKAGNRKNTYIYLTSAGYALQDKLLPLAEEINTIAICNLAPDQVQIARQVLEQITANLLENEQSLLHDENRRVPSTQQLGRLYTN